MPRETLQECEQLLYEKEIKYVVKSNNNLLVMKNPAGFTYYYYVSSGKWCGNIEKNKKYYYSRSFEDFFKKYFYQLLQ